MIPSTRDPKTWAKAGRAASAGYFIVIAILLGAGAGWWVDKEMGWAPWGLLGGFGIGMLAAAKELWMIARTTHLNSAAESAAALDAAPQNNDDDETTGGHAS